MKNITLQVLTAPGCTHCHEFLEFWKGEAAKWPNVTMKELSLITPEGQEMVGKYQIFASPGIILNDELFATGGFSKEKFLAKITELSSEEASSPSAS
jgi:glutaredoxin